MDSRALIHSDLPVLVKAGSGKAGEWENPRHRCISGMDGALSSAGLDMVTVAGKLCNHHVMRS